MFRLIYPHFDIIGSYGAVLCCQWERFCFCLKFPFLSHDQVLSCEMLFISRLKLPWSCFLSHFFPSFCHSVIYRVVSIVSDGRNQSSFVFFYVVFESLYGCVVYHFSWRAERIFQCQIPPPYVLTVYSNCVYYGFQFFFTFANSFMSSVYLRWLIFSCNLLSLYPAVHFLSMWVSGIIAIMNSRGGSASPWKIPLWIFVSAKLFSSCC